MNKLFKFFLTSAAISAALVGAVSCQKDFAPDIESLNKKVAELTQKLTDLQTKIDAGEVVTNVTTTAGGITVTTNKGTYNIVNGKDGKDGTNGTNGTNGKDGKDGKDGQNGVYYVPNPETGCFDKYTWDAEKGEYVKEATTISFVAPGAITAVWDKENNQLVFKGIEGKDPYTISLLAEVKSLVFMPNTYIDGVEALVFDNFHYFPEVIKNLTKDSEREYAVIDTVKWLNPKTKKEEWVKVDSVDVQPAILAQYHVNPTNADLSFLKEGSSDFLSFVVVPNANKIETKAKASEDFAVTPVFKSFENGVLTVEVNVVGTPADDEYLSVMALNIEKASGEFVTSDYAMLQKNELDDLVIAFKNSWAKENLATTGEAKDAHLRRALKDDDLDWDFGISEKDDEAYIKDFEAWTVGEMTLEEAQKTCDVSVKFNGTLDLKEIVAAHKVTKEGVDAKTTPVELSQAELDALGLTWEFAVVEKYVIGKKGSETDQANFVNLVNGLFTPKVYETTGEAAIGRTPIIRVALKHGDDVVEYAYIKVYISDKEGADPFDAEYQFDDSFAFACGDAAELELVTTVKYMNVNIYNRLGLGKDQFHGLYDKFIANYVVKDDKGKEIKNIGTVEEVENPEVEGTHILSWTISKEEAWENAGKEVVHYVAYQNSDNPKLVCVIKLVAKVDEFQKSFNVATSDYAQTYWNEDKTITFYNVFTPDEGETDSKKCIFLTDINISFRTWTTGDKDPKTGKQLGQLGVLKLNEDKNGVVTKIEYFFCKKDVEAIKKIGDIPVTFKVVNDTELQATIKIDGKDATETIAKINNEATTLSTNGLNAPNSISIEKNDVSKILVNTGELYTYIGAKGYACGDKEKAVAITFGDNKADHFRANIVRPVDIAPVAADYFVDALDFGEPHTYIRLEDLISPTDWRGRKFVKPYENYWKYYGIEKIEVMDNAILWDGVDGTKEAKPEAVVVKADYDTKEMGKDKAKLTSDFGFLTYRNGNAKARDFNFYVKVRVTYVWGIIETTEVQVPVHKTIGD